MSQENPTSPSYPQPPKENTSKVPPRKNNTWIYLAIIGLLLGVNAYLFFNKSKLTREKEASEINFAKADSSRAVVQQDYDAALARLDELVSQNANMDSILADNNGEIARLKGEIDKIITNKNATQAELGRAKKLVAQLNGKVQRYEARIAALEGENQQLSKSNVAITEQRDDAVTESATLRKLGSVLVASNIRMSPIDARRSGTKEVATGKAKRVDFLRIVFDIVENRIAESGPKEIFFRVLGPDGMLLSNAAYGSGVTTDSKEESLPYTFSKQISLETGIPVNNITADWKQESDYVKGNYIIEIYNAGYKIGAGGVTLK